MMMENGQTYFTNLAAFTPQDFYSMFDHKRVNQLSCMRFFFSSFTYVIRLVRNELQLNGESVRERSSNDVRLESSEAGIYLGTFIWQRIIKTEF